MQQEIIHKDIQYTTFTKSIQVLGQEIVIGLFGDYGQQADTAKQGNEYFNSYNWKSKVDKMEQFSHSFGGNIYDNTRKDMY